MSKGWYCDLCNQVVVTSQEWPLSNEPFTVGLPIAEWPTLLAVKAAEIDSETHPIVRLWATCDLVEHFLRMCTAIAAADVVERCGNLTDTLARKFLPDIERPTFGSWFKLATAAASEATSADGLVPELSSGLAEVIEPLLYSKEGWDLSSLRNDLAHGGGLGREAALYVVGQYIRRARAAFASLTWLQELDFTASCANVETPLRGTDPTLEAEFPTDSVRLESAIVCARRGETVRVLSPLLSFQIPPGRALPASCVYVRASKDHLEYLAIGAATSFIRVKSEPLRSFRRFFRFADRSSLFGVLEQDFQREFKLEASRIIGRKTDLRAIRSLVADAPRPAVVWISGQAGIGKSMLVAKLCDDLENDKKRLGAVLRWRFRSGDPRCTRVHFLRYLLRSLTSAPSQVEEYGDDPAFLEEVIQKALQLRPAPGLIILIDGLDEIVASDPSFAELPARLAADQVIWICAGRPLPLLSKVAHEQKWTTAFEDGLSPLGAVDVATWLRRDLPDGLRAQLLRDDERWIAEVLRSSEGLPQYIHLLLGELQSGETGLGSPLPRGLSAYWDKLLSSAGADDISGIVPATVATVSASIDAPTVPYLIEVLRRAALLAKTTRSDHLELVESALDRSRLFLRVERMGAGDVRVFPSHHSLRERVLTSSKLRNTLSTVRSALHDLAKTPASAEDLTVQKIALENGIRQLLADGEHPDAERVLCDFEYVHARFSCPSQSSELLTDSPVKATHSWGYYRPLSNHKGPTQSLLRDVLATATLRRTEQGLRLLNLVRQNREGLEHFGERMAFQLWMSEPPGSGLRDSATHWAMETGFSKPWLQCVGIVESRAFKEQMTLRPAQPAIAAAIHPATRLLALAHSDTDTTLWNTETGSCAGSIAGYRAQHLIFEGEKLIAADGDTINHFALHSFNAVSTRSFKAPGIVSGFYSEAARTLALVQTDTGGMLIDAGSGDVVLRAEPAAPQAEMTILPLPGTLGYLMGESRSRPSFFDWLIDSSGQRRTLQWSGVQVDLENEQVLGLGVFKGLQRLDFRRTPDEQLQAFDGCTLGLGLYLHSARAPVGGRLAFTDTGHGVYIYDPTLRRTARVVNAHDHSIDAVCLSADGSVLVTASEEIKIWRTDDILALASPTKRSPSPVTFLAIDDPSSLVVKASLEGVVELLEYPSGRLVRTLRTKNESRAKGLAHCQRSGRIAIAIGQQPRLEIHDIRQGSSYILNPPDSMWDEDSSDYWDTSYLGWEVEFLGESFASVMMRDTSQRIAWDLTSRQLVRPEDLPSRAELKIGETKLWFQEPYTPTEGTVHDNRSFVELAQVEYSGKERYRLLAEAFWHHLRPITAFTGSPNGRFALGDGEGRVVMLQLHRGVPFQPRVVGDIRNVD